MADAPGAVHEVVAEPPTVAEKIAVHLAVETIHDATEKSVPLAWDRIAPEAAVDSERRRRL